MTATGSLSGQPSALRFRPAFTLVELLVTIAILGILMGLVLPAISVVRETARRSSCQNNLKEIGTAMIHFETLNGRLPGWRDTIPAYSNSADDQVGPTRKCVSWTIPILPELGNNEVFSWYDQFSGVSGDDPNLNPQSDGAEDYNTLKQKRLPIYVCPTATMPRDNPGVLHYAVNGGTCGEVLSDPDTSPATDDDDQTQYRGDGVFIDAAGNMGSAAWSSTSGNRINYKPTRSNPLGGAGLDGDSSTLLLAERAGPASNLEQVRWAHNPLPAIANGVYYGTGSTYSEILSSGSRVEESVEAASKPHAFGHPPRIADYTSLKRAVNATQYRMVNPVWDENDTPIAGDWPFRFPSSSHRGKGANVIFCDSHTRFLSEKIDSWVYCQMLTSSKQNLSPRAAAWQKYDHDASAEDPPTGDVNYIFDEKDLEKNL